VGADREKQTQRLKSASLLVVPATRNNAWSAGIDPGHGERAGDEVGRRAAGLLQGLCLGIFGQVAHFIFVHLEDVALGNGRSADIASGIAQEVTLGHCWRDVDMPIAPPAAFCALQIADHPNTQKKQRKTLPISASSDVDTRIGQP
jgi:hypothetical protein